MVDNAPPPPTSGPSTSDGPPPIPQDGLHDLGLDSPPPVPYGQPVPAGATTELAYGQTPSTDPSTLRIANPGWRALAFAIDGIGTVVITTIFIFVGLAAGSFDFFYGILLLPLASAVLSTVLTAIWGVTPGKAMVGIRVVGVESGRPIGAWAILRSLVIVVPILLTFVLGYGVAALSRLGEGYYDSGDLSFGFGFFAPFAGWLALLIVLIVRPRHRGLEDLVGRSIVVRR